MSDSIDFCNILRIEWVLIIFVLPLRMLMQHINIFISISLYGSIDLLLPLLEWIISSFWIHEFLPMRCGRVILMSDNLIIGCQGGS